MFVTAVSTPSKPRWRWRITSYAGDVIDESGDEFATIATALQAGRQRAAQMEAPDPREKPETWRGWRYGRRTVLVVAGLALVAGVAHGEVPTSKDFAECNHEARAGRQASGVSPNQKDRDSAEQARGPAPPKGSPAPRLHAHEGRLTGERVT